MESETTFQQRLETACVLAEASLEEAFGEQRARWMERLEAEHDQFVYLLEDLWERNAAESGLRLTNLLQELWFEPQHTAEGLDWLKRFLALPAAQLAQPHEPEVFLQAYARMLEPARRQLDEASQAKFWAEGSALTIDQAVDLALRALSN